MYETLRSQVVPLESALKEVGVTRVLDKPSVS